MNAGDRVQFDSVLGDFFLAIDRPLTSEKADTFWRSLQGMHLAQFARCRDAFLAGLQSGEAPRGVTVASVWSIYRQLRARAPAPARVERYAGDVWDIAANLRLLGYIARNGRRFGQGATVEGMRTLGTAEADAPPQFTRAVGLLVAYKAAWARDMREWGGTLPSKAEQDAAWSDSMARAEAAIAEQQQVAA